MIKKAARIESDCVYFSAWLLFYAQKMKLCAKK